MLPAHLRRYVRAQRIFVGLAGLAFGVLVSVFANYVFERSTTLLPLVAAFARIKATNPRSESVAECSSSGRVGA